MQVVGRVVDTPSDQSSADASGVNVQTPSLENAASSDSAPKDSEDVGMETEVDRRGAERSDSNKNVSVGTGKAPMRPPSYKKSLGRKKRESKYSKVSAVKTECSSTNTMPVSVRSLVSERRRAGAGVQSYNPCKMPRPTTEVRKHACAQPSQATSEACDPGMVCTYCCYGAQPWGGQPMPYAPCPPVGPSVSNLPVVLPTPHIAAAS